MTRAGSSSSAFGVTTTRVSEPRYAIGIDLGTSNCAVAYAEVGAEKLDRVESLPIRQRISAAEHEDRPTLPSTIYLPAESELPDGRVDPIVGAFARDRGARAPGRLVASSKSWLCHPTVDRRAAVLPIGAPLEVERMSPVRASSLLLSHIRSAWDDRFPEAPLADQEVVLAVPASFDAVARSLTLEAAHQAGLGEHLTLIEEPQAAFYHFWAHHSDALEPPEERLILVADVGGGTTDLTLIRAGWEDGQPELSRLAVGDHILLGGDNMDMALARAAEQRMRVRLDPARWGSLVESCRRIKEDVLSVEDGPASFRVSVPGRGRRLIGGTLSTELTRTEVRELVVDGFFPPVDADARPARPQRPGLAQLGLPWEPEAAITRHVAAFLARHGDARPDRLLLNGGVFAASRLGERLAEVVRSWGATAELLPHDSLDLAVARGAAAFGLVRRGVGRRIAGGAARAYYVEVASEVRSAVCLLPRGQEPERQVTIDDRAFELIVGRPAQFQLFATTSDRTDAAGDAVPIDDDLVALPPVVTRLEHREGKTRVPVTLQAALTEVGALEVACVAAQGDERWRLEFDLRGGSGRHRDPAGSATPAGMSPAHRAIFDDHLAVVYGKAKREVSPKEVRQLFKTLQAATATKREEWTLPWLREAFELLMRGMKRRRRSADHEVMFYTLAGYLLRPGFGYPHDEWRAQDLWQLHGHGVQYHQEPAVWNAWWIMWRRTVGGLGAAQQTELLGQVERYARGEQVDTESKVVPKGEAEMLRLVASLERISPAVKADWGEWVLDRVERGRGDASSGWVLARLGARVPFSGPVHNLVDPLIVEEWAHRLLGLSWKKHRQIPYAVAHVCRRTDDRLRDVDDSIRRRAARQLDQAGEPDLAKLVREVVQLEARDEGRFAGDALPVGLVLAGGDHGSRGG